MIAVGCVLWIATMLGIAFSTKLWHFVLTQGVMQGIAGGFVLPVCVCTVLVRDSPLRLTRVVVCVPFPMVPQKTFLLDWRSLIGRYLRYVQVIDASQSMHLSKLRCRCNFCHYQSNAFALWSPKDYVDKNRGGRDRARGCLPPHQGTAKTLNDNYLVR